MPDSALTRLGSPLLQLQVLVVLALALGGGGVAFALANLAVQLAALLVLALQPRAVTHFRKNAPRALVWLVGCTLALPLLQLVPLPPSLWQALPGREMLAQSLVLAGWGADSWYPASLAPMRTLVAFCGTLAPAVVIVVGSMLSREQRLVLARSVVVAALAVLLLGAVQLSSGNTLALPYLERADPQVLYATFANRNSTALLFVLALCLLAGLPLPRARGWQLAMLGIAALLVVGAVVTMSRSGMALLLVPAGLGGLRLLAGLLRGRTATGDNRLMIWFALGGALLLAGALAASALTGGRAADSLARYAAGAADRPEMWEDGLYAAGQYWPVGSGTGTFDEVFQLHESLEYVSPRRAGRAHSDWIELGIENGLIGLALALAWLGWCLFAALRPGEAERWWTRLGAGAGLGAIALQSLLDYPLRNQALLCVAAVLVLLLASRRRVGV